MATYSIRWAFKCTDVPYRRHMVHSIEAVNLVEAALKAQGTENIEGECELVSIHKSSEVLETIMRPRSEIPYRKS